MTLREFGRAAAWLLALLVYCFTGGAGLYNGSNELPDARTPLQYAVTFGVFFYGAFGIAAGAGLLLRRRWCVVPATAWTIVVTFVATAAPLAYAEDVPPIAAMAGGAATLVIGLALIWAVRANTRRR